MQRVKKAFRAVKTRYEALVEKKFTTVAGTLVFFLILSVVPFSFWATLLFGKFLTNTEEIFELEAFSEVKEVLVFLQENARATSAGATFFLGATSLYSASNFFYHLRRSGEIIYDRPRRKGGLLVRLSALFATLATVVVLVLFFGLLVGMLWLFRFFLPEKTAAVCGFLTLLFVAFLVCWALNIYLSPFRLPFFFPVKGSALTAILWGVSTIAFSIYLKIGNLGKLYGAMTAVVVFLLWAYLMMICFVVGVIYNEHYLEKDGLKERKF